MLHCSHHTVLACRRGRGRARVHGTGTNLKVGRHRSGAKVEGGHPSGIFFCRAPPLFWLSEVQLVVLMSAFVMVSTVWSVACLLFFYSRCPLCPAICKSGGHVPPCPMESAPLEGYRPWGLSNSNFCIDIVDCLPLHVTSAPSLPTFR